MSVALAFNCGFARVAVKELTRDRAQEFQNLSYCIIPNTRWIFWKKSSRQSLFTRHCNKILDAFSRRWHPAEGHKDYLTTFSLSTWRALSDVEKTKHTLSNCSACAVHFKNLQEQFPMKPYYTITQLGICTLHPLLPRKVRERQLGKSCRRSTTSTL